MNNVLMADTLNFDFEYGINVVKPVEYTIKDKNCYCAEFNAKNKRYIVFDAKFSTGSQFKCFSRKQAKLTIKLISMEDLQFSTHTIYFFRRDLFMNEWDYMNLQVTSKLLAEVNKTWSFYNKIRISVHFIHDYLLNNMEAIYAK